MSRRKERRHRRALTLVGALAATLAVTAAAHAAQATLSFVGSPEVVFDSAREGCARIDVPDINPRAFRDSAGNIVMFALHYVNRALRGKDFSHLALDCHVVLASGLDPDPAKYNDRNYIAATWTADGRTVDALIHHEYHADAHNRCHVESALGCWYNSILAYRSTDGGESFTRAKPLVVASAPFGQDVGQGEHRGFFNPSNIFSDGRYEYFFAATTGWQGQAFGACLFRSATPDDSGSWRSYDGKDFSIRYVDPYTEHPGTAKPCMPIRPFVFPVGAVVHIRNAGLWLAVFQASRDAGVFPVDGFYYATATDLTHWSEPKLLRAGKTLFSDLCTAGDRVIAYPSLFDENATGRNFDNVGGEAEFYFTVIKVNGCRTGERLLMRQKLSIAIAPGAEQ